MKNDSQWLQILSWLFIKLVDQYSNNYNRSIGKKPIDIDYSVLTKEVEINPNVGDRVRITKYICLDWRSWNNSKVGDIVKITKYKNIFSKVTPKIGQKKYLWLILCWKLIHGCKYEQRKNNRKFLWKRIVAEYIINELLSKRRQWY